MRSVDGGRYNTTLHLKPVPCLKVIGWGQLGVVVTPIINSPHHKNNELHSLVSFPLRQVIDVSHVEQVHYSVILYSTVSQFNMEY